MIIPMRSNLIIIHTSAWRRWYFLLVATAIMATGCAGAPSQSSDVFNDEKARHQPDPQITATADRADDRLPVEQQLRSHVRKWRGTPHRMGGGNQRGIDCSGFVQRLYHDIFHRQIPRSTALQVKFGRSIGKNQLRAGDLVFFRLPHKGRHVGIYLGQAEFAHTSTSKGVTISSLEDRYWQRHYWTARRY